ncbi:hypothetical protein GE061_017658 [Apolygus lucorum]|uniref:Uncharacterized protein n=1 Tax=Apolygus lucorum TaxID=248454 RepID=A0A6A4INF5_APOLU|nr:hypothetical protein GE061_017658 [Apolygus lucorum]
MESDNEKKKRKPHPVSKANIISQGTFAWTLPLFMTGFKRELEEDDLFQPLDMHRSSKLGDEMEKMWFEEVEASRKAKREPSLLRIIIKTTWKKLAFTAFFIFMIDVVIKIVQPLMLQGLIRYFAEGSEMSVEDAYAYAAGILVCSLIPCFVLHPYMLCIQHLGMRLRIAMCSMIYRKALRLSRTALGQTTIGQIVNLMSNDVNRFDVTFMLIHNVWIGPVQTVIIGYLAYQLVGPASFIGLGFLLIFIPFQGWLGKKTSVLRLKTAVRTDERVRLMNEIITGIQVIKMYAWEKPFNTLVSLARRKEVRQIRRSGYIKAVMYSFILFHARTSVFLTIFSYALFGNYIRAEMVFVIQSYYAALRMSMSMFLPTVITQISEALVSVKRIKTFLLYDETNIPLALKGPEEQNGKKSGDFEPNPKTGDLEMTNVVHVKGEKSFIHVKHISAKWDPENEDDFLRDVSFDVNQGELTVIIGPVGSGKSSLLYAFLNELPLNKGSIEISGSVSYASQEPWLFPGSVRQNILFGQPFDRIRYRQVVMMCALLTDFDQFPFGDKTIVGERGVSLSGGQRARISLARAVYKQADIYLLDDPLSAVDTHVGKHLFEDCIQGYLKDKTVVLITHQVQYLEYVDQIVLLEDGEVTAKGTYQELQKSGLDFTKLLTASGEEPHEEPMEPVVQYTRTRLDSLQSAASSMFDLTPAEVPTAVAETRSEGSVGGRVYKAYFNATGGGSFVFFMVFLLFLIAQGFGSGGDYWLSYWVNLEEYVYNAPNGTVTVELNYPFILNREQCIYVFLGITVLTIAIALVRSFLFFIMCMRSSMKLHDNMFNSLSRTNMWFFNNNNSGRILNRFSKDIGQIDEILPATMADVVTIGITLIGIMVVNATINPYLLVPTFICGCIFYFLRVFYVSTSRSVKRLEGITRSPIFAHMSATLQGLATIRASHNEALLVREFDSHQDLNSASFYLFLACTRAFGFWLDTVCFAFITVVVLSFLFMTTNALGGDVGLAITQSIGLTGMFQWGMRQSAELENQMTCVERVVEYSVLEEEKNLYSTKEKAPRASWPEQGKLDFVKLSLRYSLDGPWILKSLSFTIFPKEKIGIVGRTGAGKSTLIQALFRLCYVEGNIIIDGLSDSLVSLHDWRSKISIIPQEPILFSGTLRKNLDPFDEIDDATLWDVLEEVELKEVVSEMSHGLQARISEGGSNLSIGQRQLICLARAIVRNNKILVLDEATANVDPQTDSLIQETIRRKFAPCTVLTIAHRLNTIMDSDRVLVMDAGSVAEFDHPHTLIQKKGIFYQMVQQTGRATEDALHRIAENHYLQTHQS